MKKSLRILMLAAAVAVCSVAAHAQSKTEKQRISREELAVKQARHIAGMVAMDDATTAKFVEAYCQCQKDVWALGPRIGGKPRRAAAQESTDNEAEQEIEARFERSQKLLAIRQRYYKEYSKFLTQKQIKRVYELEHKMMERLSKHKHNGNRHRR